MRTDEGQAFVGDIWQCTDGTDRVDGAPAVHRRCTVSDSTVC
jgi:hypothetical protein